MKTIAISVLSIVSFCLVQAKQMIAEFSWKASIGHLFQKSHSLRSSYPFPFPEFVSSDVVVFTDYQHCCDLLHMTIRVEWNNINFHSIE
jgi:hypothetical protein